MSEHKVFTPGPWKMEKIVEWPFGIHVLAGDKIIVTQDAYCCSTRQKTREDNESGVGFGHDLTTRVQAAAAIAEQDANAKLIADAPRLLAENAKLRAALIGLGDSLGCVDECFERGLRNHSPACEAAKAALRDS